MKTKFYNGLKREYDPETHYAIENWDASATFAENEYARVYFRIDCPAFDGQHGYFFDMKDREPFHAEAASVLAAFGIEENCGYCRPDEMPAIEHLYAHPQSISGVVAKNKIVPIAEAINSCKMFSCYAVDVYEDIAPISNEEFLDMLPDRKEEIIADLLAAFVTKRKNLFFGEYAADGILCRIANKYTIRRRQCESGTDQTAKAFCADVLRELVDAGRIISTETAKAGIGYRTAKTA